jgi:hypothetical protein
MQGFMTLTKDEDLTARARATELVGIIGMAVGRSYIEPVLPSFIEAAIEVFLLLSRRGITLSSRERVQIL